MLISDAPFAAYQYQHLNRPRSIPNSAVQTSIYFGQTRQLRKNSTCRMVQISAGRNVGQNSAKSGIAKQRRIWGLGVSTDYRGRGELLSISGRVLAPDLEIYRHELAYLSITEQNFCWKNYAK